MQVEQCAWSTNPLNRRIPRRSRAERRLSVRPVGQGRRQIIRDMNSTIRCLLPIDGSPFTQRAVDFLLHRLTWWRELPEVDLLHIEQPVGTALARSYLSREVLDGYYAEQSEATLRPAQAALAASGLNVRLHHLVGDAAGRITEFAREHEIDLIIMGSQGHTALGSVALGSVTTKVLASSRVPVLVVR